MNQPNVAAIACQDLNGGIGMNDGSLPWGKHKEDMAFFKQTTQNSICIMGRKTYQNIAKHIKPLPSNSLLKNRQCIVVTHDIDSIVWLKGSQTNLLPYSNSYVVDSVEKAYELAKCFTIQTNANIVGYNGDEPTKPLFENKIFFIGGRQIYEESAKYCDVLYKNVIYHDYHADVFFPQHAYKDFDKPIKITAPSADFTLFVLERNKNGQT